MKINDLNREGAKEKAVVIVNFVGVLLGFLVLAFTSIKVSDFKDVYFYLQCAFFIAIYCLLMCILLSFWLISDLQMIRNDSLRMKDPEDIFIHTPNYNKFLRFVYFLFLVGLLAVLSVIALIVFSSFTWNLVLVIVVIFSIILVVKHDWYT